MDRKTEVRRLTEPESLILDIIRGYGLDKLRFEVSCAVKALDTKTDYSALYALKNLLQRDSTPSLADLVESNMLSEQDADRLISAFRKNESIAIVGDAKSGKTMLLRAILSSVQSLDVNSDNATIFIDPTRELGVEYLHGTTNVNYHLFDEVTLSHLKMVLSENTDRIVISELKNDSDIVLLFNASSVGISTIFTMSTNLCLADELANRMSTMHTSVSASCLGTDFVVVYCDADDESKFTYEVTHVSTEALSGGIS